MVVLISGVTNGYSPERLRWHLHQPAKIGSRYKITILAFLSAVFFNSNTPLFAQKEIVSSQVNARIDGYIKQEMKERQIPGLALGIYYKGKMIKSAAYGLADVQNDAPVKVNTVFELASITKQFTASAIMLLAQEGKISVDDKINKYLPGAPDNWSEVRIRNLLSHSSGLPVIGRGFTGYDSLNTEQLKKLTGANMPASVAFAMAKTDTLSFMPNEKYTYSDVGYFLLGLIIQNASGMPYREFMQKRIFDPVGMNSTYILDQVTIHPDEARGYGLRDGKLVNIRRIWNFEVPSHFGIFSNVEDLRKWDSVLYTQKILTDNSKEQMWAPTKHNTGNVFPYGFAWNTWRNNGRRVLDHTGITGTQITRLPDDSITVVVLTNLGTGAGSAAESWGLGPEVLNIMGYSPYVTAMHTTATGAHVVKADSEKLKTFTGTYTVGASVRKLYMDNGHLMYERGKNKNELLPLSDGSYLLSGVMDEWTLKEISPGKLQWYYNEQLSVVMEESSDKK